MASATGTVSPEVLEKLFSDDLHRYELVNGELISKPMASIFHSLLMAWLSSLLIQQTENLPGWWVIADPISKIREDHWRRPDIAVIREEDAEPWKYVMPGHWPALCVEIVSAPEQAVEDLLDKCKIYHEQGVSHCWVLHPEARAAWMFDRGQEPEWVKPGGELTAPTIGVRLALPQVWRGLKNKRGLKPEPEA